jgi:histidinol dehydrogenase
MVSLIRVTQDNLDETVSKIRRRVEISDEVYEAVRQIIEDVRANGEEALVRLAKNIDKVEIEPEKILVGRDEMGKALNRVEPALIKAMKRLRKNIVRVERHRLRAMSRSVKFSDGYIVRYCWRPLSAVGCYAPGGRATYLSTILMTGVPGKVAGVPRMALATPPKRSEEDRNRVMAAAYVAGFDELLWSGGAQAIAALAYGVSRLKPVKKIIGPGNKYVVAAKQLVQRVVDVDFPAGPTELVAVVDETSNLEAVAYDMAAQAEHGPDSVTIAITQSEETAEEMLRVLERLQNNLSEDSASRRSLQSNCYVVVMDDLGTLCKFVNMIAPEHLVISVKNHDKIERQIINAGVITAGRDIPSVFVDYYAGPSHVLPTGGYAAIFSGLTVLDYVRLLSIVSGSKKSVRTAMRNIEPLIRAEGLPLHLEAFKVASGGAN